MQRLPSPAILDRIGARVRNALYKALQRRVIGEIGILPGRVRHRDQGLDLVELDLVLVVEPALEEFDGRRRLLASLNSTNESWMYSGAGSPLLVG